MHTEGVNMKAYILTLLGATIIVSVSSMMLPEGSVRKYAKLVCSVMISLTVAIPFRMIRLDFEKFDFLETGDFSVSREEAEGIYIDNLKDGIKKQVEEEFSGLGRVYVTVEDDLYIKIIEIYADKEIGDGKKKEIMEKYNPERLEIYYGEP